MTAAAKAARPLKPSPDFPLFPHASGYWARKVKGKFVYYERWSEDTDGSRSMTKLNKENARRETKEQRPEKPYPEFPLNSHANGSWYKYIPAAGGIVTFGSWKDDPKGERALAKFLEERDDLFAGRTPRGRVDDAVAPILAQVLGVKEKEVEVGEIEKVTFDELKDAAKLVVDYFGADRSVKSITPKDWTDFKFEKIDVYAPIDRKTRKPVLDEQGQPVKQPRSPDGITNLCGRVKTLFNKAEELELIDAPPRYRAVLKRVKEKRRRKARNARRGLIFTAAELHLIFDELCPAVKAMALMAINVGIGNKDISLCRFENINFETGMLDYARLKTEVERVVPLWPETIEAIEEYLKERPEVPGLDEFVFLTQKTKTLYFTETESKGGRVTRKDSMGREFTKALKKLGLYKKNLGFYSLRRTFQTIGDETGFESAVKACMAHAEQSRDMSARYRQELAKQKAAVVNYVREWYLAGRSNALLGPRLAQTGDDCAA